MWTLWSKIYFIENSFWKFYEVRSKRRISIDADSGSDFHSAVVFVTRHSLSFFNQIFLWPYCGWLISELYYKVSYKEVYHNRNIWCANWTKNFIIFLGLRFPQSQEISFHLVSNPNVPLLCPEVCYIMAELILLMGVLQNGLAKNQILKPRKKN